MIEFLNSYLLFGSSAPDVRRRWMIIPLWAAVILVGIGGLGVVGAIPLDLGQYREASRSLAASVLYWEVVALIGLMLWLTLVGLSLWHRLVDASVGKPDAD